MSTGLGVNAKLAFRVEGSELSGRGLVNTAYPTAPDTTVPNADAEEVLLGVSDLVPFLSESIDDARTQENDETLLGQAGLPGMDEVSILPAGSVEIPMFYDGLDSIIACALGFEQPLATNSPAFDVKTALTCGSAAAGTWVDGAAVYTAADIGKYIRTTSRTSQGQVRRVTGGSGNTYNITPNWDVTPDATTTGELGALEYTHTFECSNQLMTELWSDFYSSYPTGGVFTSNDQIVRRGTLGIEKSQANPWIFRSAMINSFGISATQKAGLKASVAFLPFDLDKDSATNTGSSTWDWDQDSPLFETNEKIMFSDIDYIRVAAYSTGTPLDSDDNRCISAFDLTINNNLQGDDQSACTGKYRVEPARGGMREISGTLTVPRYTADTWSTWADAETVLMAEIVLSGSTLSSNPRTLKVWLNSFKIKKFTAPIAGPSVVTQTIEFTCLIPTGQASGFPTHTSGLSPKSEIFIQTTNQNPFNAFLDQNQEY